MRLLVTLVFGLALVLPVAQLEDGADAAGKLKRVTRTSRVAQSGDGDFAIQASITGPDAPFAFSRVGKIRQLETIAITLTLKDGNTAPGDFDEGNLLLALDGIDTGIVLNGFPGANAEATLTFRGAPASRGAILAALKADGKLAATVIDKTDEGNFIEVPSQFDTTLVLTGKQKSRRR
jgi:hypothetical protein